MLPEMTTESLARKLIRKLNLECVRIIGNPQANVRKVNLPFHIFDDDNELITKIDK